MPVSLDSFINFASRQSDQATIRLDGSGRGQLKTQGFWSRLFTGAGANARKNQAAMNEFVAAVGREMGGNLETAARTALQGFLAAGKPLNAYAVREVMRSLEFEKKRIAEHNDAMVARFFAAPAGTDSQFDALMRSQSPDGVVLTEADAAEMKRQVIIFAKDETKANVPLTPDRMRYLVSQTFHRVMQRLTTGYLARVDQLCQRGLPPHLTPAQIQAIRPCIIASGARSGGELEAALAFAARIQEKLPELRNLRGAAEIVDFLGKLQAEAAKAAGGVANPHFENIYPLAFQAAFLLSDVPEAEARRIAETIMCGPPGREAVTMLNAAVEHMRASHAPADAVNIGLNLKATFDYATGALAWITPVSRQAINSLPLMGGNPEPPEPGNVQFLHLIGLWPDAGLAGSTRMQGAVAAMTYTATPALDATRILDTVGADSNLVDPIVLLNVFMNQLKAAQPDGKPFTPSVVWRTIFGREPDPDVTPANLQQKLSEAWREVVERRTVPRYRELHPDNWHSHVELAKTYLIFAASDGVNPLRALEIMAAANPADRVFTMRDLAIPRSYAVPASLSEEATRSVRDQLAKDLPRTASRLAIGGVAVPLDDAAIADEAARARFNRAAIEGNPVLDAVEQGVAALCGGGPERAAMRHTVLYALNQSALSVFRSLSPLLDAMVTEHAGCDIRVDLLESGNVRIQYDLLPPAAASGRVVYEVDSRGEGRMTGLRLEARG